MQRDQAIIKAERLRVVLSMPEYKDTIGSWLTDAHSQALREMTSAVELHEIHAAQGAYKVLEQLREQIERVFITEDAVLKRESKKKFKQETIR